MLMILNDIVNLTYDGSIPFKQNSILFPLKSITDTKIHIISGTQISKEIKILNSKLNSEQVNNDVELIILSEPKSELLTEAEYNYFVQNYQSSISKGIK